MALVNLTDASKYSAIARPNAKFASLLLVPYRDRSPSFGSFCIASNLNWEIEGIEPVQMSGYIKTECYDRIARDIRRRVVEAGKQRGWGKKRKAVKSNTQRKKQAANSSNDEGDRQISLF
jgi:hypothetical protein